MHNLKYFCIGLFYILCSTAAAQSEPTPVPPTPLVPSVAVAGTPQLDAKRLSQPTRVGCEAGSTGTVIRFGDKLKLVYPVMLRKDGVEGEVLIGFMKHADGRITDITVLRSSHKLFSEAVITAVSQLPLIPCPSALKNNAPPVRVQIPIKFALR